MEAGAGNHRSRANAYISNAIDGSETFRNLTRTGIILTLGTEPTRKPAIVHRHECLQVPVREDIAHVEGIPDPEPGTLFLVDHHVFSNCDRQDVFTYNDEKDDGNGNVIIGYLVGK